MSNMRINAALLGAAAGVVLAANASAGTVQLRVTATNLSPTNSLSFAPLRVGFNNGTYDAFNNGQAATAPIISIAEGGSGVDWFPAFAAADPTATLGTVLPNPAGPLLPGASGTMTFDVDPAVNRFFTFGSMVVPSNDYFIGNDSPTRYQLFDAGGNLVINQISQFGRDIWDAGSELDGPFGAAFLVGSNNDDRIPQNGVVNFDFEGLDVFNGLTTAAGYIFQRQISADTEVYRITFEVVPSPGTAGLLAAAGLTGLRRRSRSR
ncbi:MAG: spondin domain-containing protein [Phycisphaerales bacterium]